MITEHFGSMIKIIYFPIQPSLFNPVTNGKGHSIIFFGILSNTFDPNSSDDSRCQFELVREFVSRIPGGDVLFGQKMKLIPRVVNVEEWSNDIKMSRHYS